MILLFEGSYKSLALAHGISSEGSPSHMPLRDAFNIGSASPTVSGLARQGVRIRP